jgi:hypothetical protein
MDENRVERKLKVTIFASAAPINLWSEKLLAQ